MFEVKEVTGWLKGRLPGVVRLKCGVWIICAQKHLAWFKENNEDLSKMFKFASRASMPKLNVTMEDA